MVERTLNVSLRVKHVHFDTVLKMLQPWKVERQSEDMAFSPTEDEEVAFLSNTTNAEKGLGREESSKKWHRSPSFSRATLPWMISTLVLAILLIASLVWQLSFQPSPACDVFKLATDLPDARSAIIYEHQSYTGALSYDKTTKTVVRLHDGPVEFFGPPSDAIEDAWEDTLRHEFPILYSEEVPDGLDNKNRLKTDNHFHFEPDLFHNLHCLNEVRKQVSKIIYPDLDYKSPYDAPDDFFPANWTNNHMEHCMDRIRQALLCHGDMTPSIMHNFDGINFPLYHTDVRLCRKWAPLRAWVDERARRDEKTLTKDVEEEKS